ncbi:putative isxac3 transposase orfb (fragment) protein [Xanthomonas albilineans GPE PC73]|uniref:Putative isxac3 transposase orfb protein n=1 Tax=Xanthomonas albilineans (strain GPE PC73 / CFBP 7063) TaxID=380358 RepID=D2UCP4_XANAP
MGDGASHVFMPCLCSMARQLTGQRIGGECLRPAQTRADEAADPPTKDAARADAFDYIEMLYNSTNAAIVPMTICGL